MWALKYLKSKLSLLLILLLGSLLGLFEAVIVRELVGGIGGLPPLVLLAGLVKIGVVFPVLLVLL